MNAKALAVAVKEAAMEMIIGAAGVTVAKISN
jgi:hypothetical protein